MKVRAIGVTLGACALTLAFTGSALANHNVTADAKGAKSKQTIPFVQGYQPCTAPSASITDNKGTACAAAVLSGNRAGPTSQLTSTVTFVPAGKAPKYPKFVDKTKFDGEDGDDVSDYWVSDDQTAPGHLGPDLSIVTSGVGILNSTGSAPYTGGSTALVTARFADHNCAAGATAPCTTEAPFPIGKRTGGTGVNSCVAGVCNDFTTANISVNNVFVGPAPYAFVENMQSNLQVGPTCIGGSACEGLVVGKLAKGDVQEPGFYVPAKSANLAKPLVRSARYGNPCSSIGAGSDVRNSPLSILNACSPSEAEVTAYKFGPKGIGSIQMKPKSPDIQANVQLKDVQTAAGTPVTGTGLFELRGVARVTHQDCSGAAICTRPDQQVTMSLDCSKGTCKASKASKGLLGLNLPLSKANVRLGSGSPAAPNSPANTEFCVYETATNKAFACPGFFVP